MTKKVIIFLYKNNFTLVLCRNSGWFGLFMYIITTTLKTAPIMRPRLCATSTVYSEMTKNIANRTISRGWDDIVYTITLNTAQPTICNTKYVNSNFQNAYYRRMKCDVDGHIIKIIRVQIQTVLLMFVRKISVYHDFYSN